MVQNIEIKNIDFKYVDQKMQKEILEYISSKVVEVFRKNVVKVYVKNAPFLKGNYIPLEEMIDAIAVETNNNPLSCKIFIDEGKLNWKDRDGNKVHSIPFQNVYEPGFVSREVKSLEDYWEMPISGIQEQEWAVTETLSEIDNFFKTDLVNYIKNKLIKQRSVIKNGKQ